MTTSRQEYWIEPQRFDSGRIAGRVGVVRLEDPGAAQPDLGAAIVEEGRREGYDLLCLQAPEPIELEGFEPRGVIATLTGLLGEIADRLRGVTPVRAGVQTLRADDWPAVRGLLRWAAPTRFSTDPHVPAEVAREHKMAMLMAHAERFPDHALLALADGDETQVVGFQFSYIEAGDVVLYEIVVDPAYRRGFAAAGLLAENVRRFLAAPGATVGRDRRALSRIYVDNRASMRLFERIGMHPAGLREHHFHAWL